MQHCFFIAWFCLCSTFRSQVSLSDVSLLPCNGSMKHLTGRKDSAAGALLPSQSWDGLSARDGFLPYTSAPWEQSSVGVPRDPAVNYAHQGVFSRDECSKYERAAVSLVPLLPPCCFNLYYGEVWGTPCCQCKPNVTLTTTSWEAESSSLLLFQLFTLIFEINVSAFVKGR